MVRDKLLGRIRYPIQYSLSRAYRAIPSAIFYGKTFWQTYNFLQESQWWSTEKLEEYQMQQLSKLLHHAYKNVPYYRKIFDGRGLKPGDIQEVDDLKKLPCLDKDTFKSHYNEMMAKNVTPTRLKTVHTSGSTGKPLQFYQDHSEIEKEWAFGFHQWSRVGYTPGDLRIRLGGVSIGPSALTMNNPTSYDLWHNILYLWPSISRKKDVINYLEIIRFFRSKFLLGYPSSIASFAQLVERYSLAVPFELKAIFLSSELVYDWQREIAQEVFDCRVFAHYGLAEHVATATECEHTHYYHFIPQYGITEIDPDTHEIVATGFLNFVNPFIRYRTGDVASLPALSKCKYCGRNYFPVVKRLEGRTGDFIITPQETLIPPGFLVDALFSDFKTIKNSQLIQTSVDCVILRAEIYDKKHLHRSDAELQILRQNIQRILGDEIQIKVEVVDEIEGLESGKFRWIISEIADARIRAKLN